MASIADQILIKMGLDSSQLEAGLNRSKQQIGATTQAMDKMGAKWVSTAKMLTTTILAPVAGFMSLGAVIKSYFSGVSQVAQMTGAYNTKMEEWRKKRAMLARYNKEDIELYKKGREAVTKFQITMDDLSAKIMRSVSPAIKWLIDKLNDFSNWIDRNSQNIIRFLGVVAGTITALLIPSFIKLGLAMLTNPLTWIIALLGILILIIDDLVTYLRGGESALDAFWSQFGSREQILAKIQTAIKLTVATLEAMWESLKAGVKTAIDWFGEFWSSCNGTERVINTLKDVFHSVVQTVKDAIAIWDALVDSMKKTGFLDDLANAFDGALSFILGAFKLFFSALQAIFGLIKGLLTGDWGSFKEAVSKAVESAEEAFSGLLKIIDSVLNQLWELSKEIFGRIGSSLTGVIVSAVEEAKNTLLSLFESIKAIVNQVEEQIKEVLTRIGDSIKSSISDAVDGIKSAFTGLLDTVNGLVDTVSNTFSGIIQVVKDKFNGLLDTVSNTFSGIFQVIKDNFNSLVDTVSNTFSGIIQVVKDKFNGLLDTVSNTFSGIFQVIKDKFNGLLDTVNSLIDAILNLGSSIVKALNIDALLDKVKAKLAGILPDWVKSKLGINEDGKQTEQPKINEDGKQTEQPKINEGTDAPIVPDVQNMQAMNAQSKGNVNNNVNRSQVINIGSNNPAVVTATMREADYEMNNADRDIAMASQGAGW